MTHAIIRTKDFIDLGVELKKNDSYTYHHLCFTGRDLISNVRNLDVLKNSISNIAKVSKYLPLWRDKESMYSFENVEDICFSQEYYTLKSKITEDAFRAVIITDDLEVFEVQAEIVGTYKDFKASGSFDVIFVTRYRDNLHMTPYSEVSYFTISDYLSTRGLDTL